MAEFSFRRYVSRRQQEVFGGLDESSRYAFGADLAMLRGFRRAPAVERVIAAVIRTYKDVLRNQYLGTTVRVGPSQLPRIWNLAKECADDLGVPMPTLYVANSPFMNAYTFGTDEDSFIVVHSKLVDDFSDLELKFVIGHEMGHVQNKHVVYGTALRLLKANLTLVLRLLTPPLEAALLAWARRAEITCDRAGLLCCRDLDAATRAFMKMACGSTKLYHELDATEYLRQLEAGQKGVGKYRELLASHPYLPKRIQSLKLFAQSQLYRRAAGLGRDGLSMKDVDAQVAEIVKVVHMPTPGRKTSVTSQGDSGTEVDVIAAGSAPDSPPGPVDGEPADGEPADRDPTKPPETDGSIPDGSDET